MSPGSRESGIQRNHNAAWKVTWKRCAGRRAASRRQGRQAGTPWEFRGLHRGSSTTEKPPRMRITPRLSIAPDRIAHEEMFATWTSGIYLPWARWRENRYLRETGRRHFSLCDVLLNSLERALSCKQYLFLELSMRLVWGSKASSRSMQIMLDICIDKTSSPQTWGLKKYLILFKLQKTLSTEKEEKPRADLLLLHLSNTLEAPLSRKGSRLCSEGRSVCGTHLLLSELQGGYMSGLEIPQKDPSLLKGHCTKHNKAVYYCMLFFQLTSFKSAWTEGIPCAPHLARRLSEFHILLVLIYLSF